MATIERTLTEKACSSLPSGRYKDAVTRGLNLEVGKRARTFIYLYKFQGRTAYINIGRLDADVTLLGASRQVSRIQDKLSAGIDPKEGQRAKPSANSAVTFGEAWKEYKTSHLAQRRNSKKEADVVELDTLQKLRSRALSAITRDEARYMLSERLKASSARQNARLATANKPTSPTAGHYAAKNLHLRLKAFFNWAIERDYVETNPFEKLGVTWVTLARERVLSVKELITALKCLADHPGPTYRALITFLVLTGMRDKSEVTALRFGWVDWSDSSATIPSSQAKEQTNTIALPMRVLQILRKLQIKAQTTDTKDISSAYVLSTDGKRRYSGLSKDKAKLDALPLKDFEPFTHHDIRRSIAAGLAGLGIPENVVERGVLRHLPAGKSDLRRTYQRHEYVNEARDALEQWSSHLETTAKNQEKEAEEARLAKAKEQRTDKIIQTEIEAAEKWAEENPEEYQKIVEQNAKNPLIRRQSPDLFGSIKVDRGHRGRQEP